MNRDGNERTSAGSQIDRYDDMLHLPHPVSRKHPPMPPENRAAQFAPFAALTGYDTEIEKTAEQHEQEVEKRS